MSFNDSKLIDSKNATISASSKTGVWDDSRTSLGGLARAADERWRPSASHYLRLKVKNDLLGGWAEMRASNSP
jgi:hypothetical protein